MKKNNSEKIHLEIWSITKKTKTVIFLFTDTVMGKMNKNLKLLVKPAKKLINKLQKIKKV